MGFGARAARGLGRWRFGRAAEGEDLLEYGLLAALVAVVALGAVATFGQTIYDVFWDTIAHNF